MTLSNNRVATYGGNILVGQYNFSNSGPICTDMIVAIKKVNETDADSSYTMHA